MKSVVINRIIIFPYMISIIRNSLSSWRSFKILSFNQNKGDIINFEFHVLFCFFCLFISVLVFVLVHKSILKKLVQYGFNRQET